MKNSIEYGNYWEKLISSKYFLTTCLLKMLEKRNAILNENEVSYLEKSTYIVSFAHTSFEILHDQFNCCNNVPNKKCAEINHCNIDFLKCLFSVLAMTHLKFVKGDSLIIVLYQHPLFSKVHFPLYNFSKFSLQCYLNFMNVIINLFRWCFSSSSISCVC